MWKTMFPTILRVQLIYCIDICCSHTTNPQSNSLSNALPELPLWNQFHCSMAAPLKKKTSHENTTHTLSHHTQGYCMVNSRGKGGSSNSGRCEGRHSADSTEAEPRRLGAYRWLGACIGYVYAGERREDVGIYSMYVGVKVRTCYWRASETDGALMEEIMRVREGTVGCREHWHRAQPDQTCYQESVHGVRCVHVLECGGQVLTHAVLLSMSNTRIHSNMLVYPMKHSLIFCCFKKKNLVFQIQQ